MHIKDPFTVFLLKISQQDTADKIKLFPANTIERLRNKKPNESQLFCLSEMSPLSM